MSCPVHGELSKSMGFGLLIRWSSVRVTQCPPNTSVFAIAVTNNQRTVPQNAIKANAGCTSEFEGAPANLFAEQSRVAELYGRATGLDHFRFRELGVEGREPRCADSTASLCTTQGVGEWFIRPMRFHSKDFAGAQQLRRRTAVSR